MDYCPRIDVDEVMEFLENQPEQWEGYCQLNRECSKLSTIILEHPALLNVMQQLSSKRFLATSQSVDVVVHDIILHSVRAALGESVLKWVQREKGVVQPDRISDDSTPKAMLGIHNRKSRTN
jgi:hypothetical protein